MLGSRVRAREQGFTLIEVLVGLMMLAFIVTAGSTLYIAGNHGSVAGQRLSQLISVADQQIETIREEVKTQGFAELAMQTTPSALPSAFAYTSYDSSTLNADPNAFVVSKAGCGASSEEFKIEANYDNTGEGQPVDPQQTTANASLPWSSCDSGTEPLEVISSTTLAFVKPQQTVSVGTDTAVVDTYVTDTYVGCNSGGFSSCPSTSSGSIVCSSSNFPTAGSPSSTTCADARRVTVAVVLNRHGRYDIGPAAPVYVSAIFTNPTPANEPTNTVGLTLGLQLG
jgi:prepilin-type N-terminal cleavage/methylation domain-containing protein